MKKTVAVFFGGRSAEHEVSIITGHLPVISTLLSIPEYDVVPVYISKEGYWYSTPEMNELNYFKDNYEAKIQGLKKLQFSFDDGLTLIWPGAFSKKKKINIAFPALHGTYGEDGSLMGLLRMAGVPFVGCDIFASAVAMDKVLTKQVLAAEGVPIVPYVWFTKGTFDVSKVSQLKWPLFVKPVHLGSSIGITKASNETELQNAIEVAFHYDNKVLVEEAVPNLIEVTLPIMGNAQPEPALVQRSLTENMFLDFDKKYISGGKKTGSVNNASIEMPAKIDQKLYDNVVALGTQTYKSLGCEGIARVDFLIDSATGQIYVNEVNTLPGSLYDHNWRKAGVSNLELITKLIGFAEERYARQKETTFAFKSDILKSIGGAKFSQ